MGGPPMSLVQKNAGEPPVPRKTGKRNMTTPTTTRRDFLKQAAILAGVGAAGGLFPESIARAMAIEPAAGMSVLDAEHVVILMQENRSFDHTFGTLRGVRGFEDPCAI